MCRCISLAKIELFMKSYKVTLYLHTYTCTHTFVDIQEMHYFLLMILHDDMVNDPSNYFYTPEVLQDGTPVTFAVRCGC